MKGVKYFFTIILFLFLFFSKSNLAFAENCVCDGNQNVTQNNCDTGKYPICGGRGSNVVCSCHDNLPTATPLNSPSLRGTRQNNLCGDGVSVKTVLGCVPVEMGALIEWLLPYIFGIAGGIAFLLMIFGFFLLSTSQGDPKKVEGAKATVTSAITGLLICIFAIFILRLIAVDILHIPGINK